MARRWPFFQGFIRWKRLEIIFFRQLSSLRSWRDFARVLLFRRWSREGIGEEMSWISLVSRARIKKKNGGSAAKYRSLTIPASYRQENDAKHTNACKSETIILFTVWGQILDLSLVGDELSPRNARLFQLYKYLIKHPSPWRVFGEWSFFLSEWRCEVPC